MTAPFIPKTAPFSEDQRAWLNGYLAGLYSSQEATGGAAAEPAKPVTILFGSQTGTAESLSKKAAKQLKAANCEPKIVDMSDVTVEEMKAIENLLIITSTYGEGDPPDNATSLHGALMAEGAPSMEGVNFSVLGLGDSSYPDFCQCSKEFDSRLEALGATRFSPMTECDGDPDEPYAVWMGEVQKALSDANTLSVPVKDDLDEESGYTKKNPFPANLLTTVDLNKEGSSKSTHHIEISLEGSGLDYEVGDALGVWPVNNIELVAQVIKAAGFVAEEVAPLSDMSEVALSEALSSHYDISVLNEPFLLACSRLSKNDELAAIVADEEKLKAYLPGRSIIDPILDFDVKFPTPAYFVSTLKALQPRLYSISSSPKAHPGEVHLTVGKVTYLTHERERMGSAPAIWRIRVRRKVWFGSIFTRTRHSA